MSLLKSGPKNEIDLFEHRAIEREDHALRAALRGLRLDELRAMRAHANTLISERPDEPMDLESMEYRVSIERLWDGANRRRQGPWGIWGYDPDRRVLMRLDSRFCEHGHVHTRFVIPRNDAERALVEAHPPEDTSHCGYYEIDLDDAFRDVASLLRCIAHIGTKNREVFADFMRALIALDVIHYGGLGWRVAVDADDVEPASSMTGDADDVEPARSMTGDAELDATSSTCTAARC